MPRDVNVGVILRGKDRASDDVRKVDKSFGSLNKTVVSGVKKYLAIGTAIYGVKKAISMALDNASYAANVQQVRMSFESIAEQAGNSADAILKSMREMSGGTITELDMMLAANRAALLGLPVDKLDQLMQIARASATATGESVQQMFNDIVTGIGRTSPMILDNLGITVKIGEATKAYGEQIGKAANQLTGAEKQQALLNAVLAQGETIMRRVGEAGQQITAAERPQMLTAAWADLRAELGKRLLPVYVKLSEWGTKIVRGLLPYVSQMPAVFKAVGEIVQRIMKLTFSGKVIANAIDSMAKRVVDAMALAAEFIPKIFLEAFAVIAEEGPGLLWAAIKQGFLDRLSTAWNEFTKIWKIDTKAVESPDMVSDQWKKALEDAAPRFKSIVDNFLQYMKQTIVATGEMASSMVEPFKDDALLNELIDKLKALGEEAEEVGEEIGSNLRTGIENGLKDLTLPAEIKKLWDQTEEAALLKLEASLDGVVKQVGLVNEELNNILALDAKLSAADEETVANYREQLRQLNAVKDVLWGKILAIKMRQNEEDNRHIKEWARLQRSAYENEIADIRERAAEFVSAGVSYLEVEKWREGAIDAVNKKREEELALLEAQRNEAERLATIEETRTALGPAIGAAEAFAGTEVGKATGTAEALGTGLTVGFDEQLLTGLADFALNMDVVNAILNPVSAGLGLLQQAIGWLVAQISGALTETETWKVFQEGIKTFFSQIVVPLATAIQPLLVFFQQLLSAIAPYLVAAFNMLGELMKRLQPLWDALALVLESVFKLFLSILPVIFTFISIIGNILAPIFAALAPVIDAIGRIFEALSPVINTVMSVLGVFGTLIGGVAATLGWLATKILALGEVILYAITFQWKKIEDVDWGESFSEALDEIVVESVENVAFDVAGAGFTDFGPSGDLFGPGAEDFAPFGEEPAPTIVGGETTIQRAPEFHIYQTFEGPIVGASGMAEVGEFMVEAVEDYLGQGGVVEWLEAPAT